MHSALREWKDWEREKEDTVSCDTVWDWCERRKDEWLTKMFMFKTEQVLIHFSGHISVATKGTSRQSQFESIQSLLILFSLSSFLR